MEPVKLIWGLRGIIYKLFFGKVGNMSYIGKPVYVRNSRNVFIGNRVRIYPGLRIETEGTGKIYINDNTSIAQNVHITAGGENLVIGRDTTILGSCFITNIDHDYQQIGISILRQREIVSTTMIGDNCFIGYGAAIQAGTVLGRQCIVGAHSVVRGIFPDYCVIVGAPGRIVKKYDCKTGAWISIKESTMES